MLTFPDLPWQPVYCWTHHGRPHQDIQEEQGLTRSTPTPLFDWMAETQRGKGTHSGLHTEVLIDPEQEHQDAGSSMSTFSAIPHCLKEKCQLEAQKVTKLVMTIMDDYVFSEGMKKRAE